LRRRTAVKLLPTKLAGEQNIKRFEREVQLTATLTHPNTIAIYDYGRSPDGVFYYAMEYLDGVDLEQLVQKTGAQPPALVVRLLEQICAALAEAHAHGLIHRDIKPANVFVCERGGMSGFVKVMDFGLVKQLTPTDDAGLSGSVDVILGTPLYLSPEGISRPHQVDARSDLYAVGAVGYWLLTGMPLFDGRTPVEVCGQHLHTPPVPPSQRLGRPLPEALEALILACLEKDPAMRPGSAAAMMARLVGLRAELPWSDDDAHGWWASCRLLASDPPDGAFAPTDRLRTVELKKRAGLS
jgi:serine/threonine protein kinase